MAFIPLPDTVTAELLFTLNSQEVENVLHFRRDVDFNDPTNMALLGQSLITWWDTYLKANVPGTVYLRKVRVYDASVENGVGLEETDNLPIEGTKASPGLPGNVTVTCKLNTGYRGRSFRGRIYHVGISEDVVAEDNITGAFQTTLTTAYEQLLFLNQVANYYLVVASKYHNGLPRATGIVTQVTSVFVNNVVDSQRRRLTGRGR